MTGRSPIWKNSDGPNNSIFESPSVQSSGYIDFSFARYLGGHPLYQKATSTGVYFYDDRIEIVDPELSIPYSAMTRVEVMGANRIYHEKLNVPLEQLLKNYLYTIIQYAETDSLGLTSRSTSNRGKDVTSKITIVLDFDKNMVARIKTYIYTRMVETK